MAVHLDSGILCSNKKKWVINDQKQKQTNKQKKNTPNNLKCILLNEKSQLEKAIYFLNPTMWNFGKGKNTETGKRFPGVMGGRLMKRQGTEDI